eukprot:TRINITY_DN4134_c0_g4_i1.p1 TRINITY_DN4134_c0_g4~~TRINITY_DN4134_c0_g4_i1.p1  ORF type:complete len:370 (+),score=117.20 TRINITY_DN4134_c0_g4_i1:115-1110(+)
MPTNAQLTALIQQCCAVDPEERPAMSQVVASLQALLPAAVTGMVEAPQPVAAPVHVAPVAQRPVQQQQQQQQQQPVAQQVPLQQQQQQQQQQQPVTSSVSYQQQQQYQPIAAAVQEQPYQVPARQTPAPAPPLATPHDEVATLRRQVLDVETEIAVQEHALELSWAWEQAVADTQLSEAEMRSLGRRTARNEVLYAGADQRARNIEETKRKVLQETGGSEPPASRPIELRISKLQAVERDLKQRLEDARRPPTVVQYISGGTVVPSPSPDLSALKATLARLEANTQQIRAGTDEILANQDADKEVLHNTYNTVQDLRVTAEHTQRAVQRQR